MVQERSLRVSVEFAGFRRVYRVQERSLLCLGEFRGSGEFTGLRRVYRGKKSLLDSGEEFTGFRRVYRFHERCLQGSGEFTGFRGGVYRVQESFKVQKRSLLG